MDSSGSCRILVNPKNISMFKNKSNCAINPPIDDFIKRRIQPHRWFVENGELKYKSDGVRKNIAPINNYELIEQREKSERSKEAIALALMTIAALGVLWLVK